jgi:hypothetical protein
MSLQNYEESGIRIETFGKKNQFQRKVQMPWSWITKTELNLFELIPAITERFTVIESLSMESRHTARIVDNKSGEPFDIELNRFCITVYPTSNNHQDSSDRLLKIIKDSWC